MCVSVCCACVCVCMCVGRQTSADGSAWPQLHGPLPKSQGLVSPLPTPLIPACVTTLCVCVCVCVFGMGGGHPWVAGQWVVTDGDGDGGGQCDHLAFTSIIPPLHLSTQLTSRVKDGGRR